jgi:hypothetical protein
MILCGLAKLNYRPAKETMEALLEGCVVRNAVPEPISSEGNDNIAGGDGRSDEEASRERGPLGVGSRREGWQGPSQNLSNSRVSSTTRYNCLGPQGMSNVLWALAVLLYRPPSPWLHSCLSEAMELLPQMRMQELAMTIWAVATLKVRWIMDPHHLLAACTNRAIQCLRISYYT